MFCRFNSSFGASLSSTAHARRCTSSEHPNLSKCVRWEQSLSSILIVRSDEWRVVLYPISKHIFGKSNIQCGMRSYRRHSPQPPAPAASGVLHAVAFDRIHHSACMCDRVSEWNVRARRVCVCVFSSLLHNIHAMVRKTITFRTCRSCM